MTDELYEVLGIDPDNPKTREGLEDAAAAEALVDQLVDAREERGLTQAELAAYMKTTQSAVSKFERAGGDPRLSTLQRYARSVGLALQARAVSPSRAYRSVGVSTGTAVVAVDSTWTAPSVEHALLTDVA